MPNSPAENDSPILAPSTSPISMKIHCIAWHSPVHAGGEYIQPPVDNPQTLARDVTDTTLSSKPRLTERTGQPGSGWL